jgi:hypothetical protein
MLGRALDVLAQQLLLTLTSLYYVFDQETDYRYIKLFTLTYQMLEKRKRFNSMYHFINDRAAQKTSNMTVLGKMKRFLLYNGIYQVTMPERFRVVFSRIG